MVQWLWDEYLDLVKLKKVEKKGKYGKRKWEDYIKEEELQDSKFEEIPKLETNTKMIKQSTQNPYKRDNRWFNEREIDECDQNEYINGRLASNMYREAKENLGKLLKNS